MNLKTPTRPEEEARGDGSALSKEDIERFRVTIKGTVVVKAEARGVVGGEYERAVKRWNEVFIRQAVS